MSSSPMPAKPVPSGSSIVTANRQMSGGLSQAWDVSPNAKATSDRFFAQLDAQNLGVIEGDVAVPFMLQSQLEEAILASIW